MAKMHIKTGDTVVVLSGNSKGVRTHVDIVDGKKVRVCSHKDANGNPCGHHFE